MSLLTLNQTITHWKSNKTIFAFNESIVIMREMQRNTKYFGRINHNKYFPNKYNENIYFLKIIYLKESINFSSHLYLKIYENVSKMISWKLWILTEINIDFCLKICANDLFGTPVVNSWIHFWIKTKKREIYLLKFHYFYCFLHNYDSLAT